MTGRKSRFRVSNPVVLIALISLLILVGSVGLAVGSLKQIEIQADGSVLEITTRCSTVEDVLNEAGIDVSDWDEVTPGLDVRVENHSVITVNRAMPVCVNQGKESNYLYTTQTSVKGVLDQAGIYLGPVDKVEPSPDVPVERHLTIRVTRVSRDLVVEEERVPFATVKREDSGLDEGSSKVIEEGKDGVKRIIREVITEDGRVVESKTISEEMVSEPLTKVVAVGTSGVISRGGQSFRYKKALDVVATAYTPGPESNGPWANGITALGLKAGYGIVAVDPKVISLRSRLYVEGYGFGLAGDTGGAIKGNRIDVCFEDLQQALKWGVKRVRVYVLE